MNSFQIFQGWAAFPAVCRPGQVHRQGGSGELLDLHWLLLIFSIFSSWSLLVFAEIHCCSGKTFTVKVHRQRRSGELLDLNWLLMIFSWCSLLVDLYWSSPIKSVGEDDQSLLIFTNICLERSSSSVLKLLMEEALSAMILHFSAPRTNTKAFKLGQEVISPFQSRHNEQIFFFFMSAPNNAKLWSFFT